MILKAVTVFAEGIFEDETHVVHPKRDSISSEIKISLLPLKDISLDIHIRVSCLSKQLVLLVQMLNSYSTKKFSNIKKYLYN